MRAKRLLTAFLLILGVMGADQFSKAYVLYVLASSLPLSVTSFFDLVLFRNQGVSFGLLGSGDHFWFLVTTACVVTITLGVWLVRESRGGASVALALVIGGALGNLIDRFRFEAVIDFLYFHVGAYYWPAFNIADTMICVGVGLLLYDTLCLSKEKSKTKRS